MSEHHDSGAVSRRTLAKGAAWSIPALTVAAAAPALAASLTCEASVVRRATVTSQNGSANRRYSISVSVTNSGTEPVVFTALGPNGVVILNGESETVNPGSSTDWWITFRAPKARTGKRMVFTATWDCGTSEFVVPATGLTA
ncbi:hypothetical protein ACMYYO_11925 [Dermacoccaceae bacterium W4C1]